ncbi:hypothetical protein MUK42_33860 [Musa troglodytarum]|uniref:Uncharacterized protein n=1 Tax=Musa troglodytarum TaxID=320322 RepID=A0A9E7H2Q6_9LILI|nr:hypothetical protein MUK42_33860 [Musa troglodytarum]
MGLLISPVEDEADGWLSKSPQRSSLSPVSPRSTHHPPAPLPHGSRLPSGNCDGFFLPQWLSPLLFPIYGLGGTQSRSVVARREESKEKGRG